MKWQEITAQGGDFVDFMCGSGTLIIEAAMISSKMAPGTFRKYYGFLKWLGHDAQIWNELQQEMQDVRIRNVESIQSKFIANDIHRMTARSARMNMEKAGVGRMISLHTQSYEEIVAPSEFGLVLVNPPYGERLTERKSVWGGRKEESRVIASPEESENNLAEMKIFYKKIGDHFKQHYKGWKAGVFVEEGELSRSVGLKPTQRFPFFNGAIDCRLLSYDLY
jgi:23S rRNA (guanine2445-N2)-methyltransferase / 23S rRNA (guanine2069-N7)-methyltransferase